MQKNSFFYIHSNHTMPLIKDLKLPAGVQSIEINDLESVIELNRARYFTQERKQSNTRAFNGPKENYFFDTDSF